MSVTPTEMAAICLAGAATVLLLGARLSAAAQPLRLKLANEGEALLAEPKLSVQMKASITHMLDTAFGMRWTLIFGFLAVPIILVHWLLEPSRYYRTVTGRIAPSATLQGRYDALERLHDRIILANHPVLMPLLEAWIVVFGTTAVLMIALLRGKVPLDLNRGVVMAAVESTEPAVLRRRLSHA